MTLPASLSEIYLRRVPYTAEYRPAWHTAPPTMLPSVTGRRFFRKMSDQAMSPEEPLNIPRGRRNMLATCQMSPSAKVVHSGVGRVEQMYLERTR